MFPWAELGHPRPSVVAATSCFSNPKPWSSNRIWDVARRFRRKRGRAKSWGNGIGEGPFQTPCLAASSSMVRFAHVIVLQLPTFFPARKGRRPPPARGGQKHRQDRAQF